MNRTTLILAVVLLLATIVAVFLYANRPRRVPISAPLPQDFSQHEFNHDSFEGLLQEFVSTDGRIDYALWHANTGARSGLDSYLAAVSRYSPENAPERFPKRSDELAYWMYGYNAYVIKSVLDHYPIASVTDVKAPIEAVTGLGFFHQLRFSFGGDYLSLMHVENKKIRERFNDPRIHFVLNCASESCPIARPELPTGDELETLLSDAARDFVNDKANVSVDHTAKTVSLSRIFKWYKSDFDVGGGLISFVTQYANPDLANEIALASDYEIQFQDYDWGLNSTH